MGSTGHRTIKYFCLDPFQASMNRQNPMPYEDFIRKLFLSASQPVQDSEGSLPMWPEQKHTFVLQAAFPIADPAPADERESNEGIALNLLPVDV